MTTAPSGQLETTAVIPGRLLWLIFILALAIRLTNAALMAADVQNFFFEDSPIYWDGSKYFLETGRFSPGASGSASGIAPGTERVPVYLFLIAGIRAIFGDGPLAAIFVQCVIDSATCVLVAFLGGMLGGRVGILSGLLAACWPNLIIHAATLLSDTVFVFFFTAMLLFSARFLADARPRVAGVAGLLCGLAIMTRSVAQFLPFAMALTAPAVALAQRKGAKTALFAALMFTLGVAAPVGPWVARNAILFDTLTLTSQSGSHLVNWVLPLIRQAQDGTPHDVAAREMDEKFSNHLLTEGIDPKSLNPFERSRHLTEFGVAELASFPFTIIARAWIKGAIINVLAPTIAIDPRVRRLRSASFYNDPTPGFVGRLTSYLSTSAPQVRPWIIGALIMSGFSCLLQILGFVRLARMKPWASVFAGLVILYVLLITGPVYSPKYRLPIEPVLIVLTALGLESLWRLQARLSQSPKA